VSYVPSGYDVKGENPEVVKLIALVAPAKAAGLTATFSLSGTTCYPGYCMNKGTSPEPDFALPTNKTVAFAADGTARIDLTSRDYAGYTQARVDVKRGTKVVGWATKNVPLDENGDHIADCGWDATDGDHNSHAADPGKGHEGDDADNDPAGQGINGDNLTALEEYRGFFVRDSHRRTDPTKKDLFAYSEVRIGGTPTIRYASNLTCWTHRIYQGEMSAQAVINHIHGATMPGDGSHVNQRVVQIIPGGYNPDASGFTHQFNTNIPMAANYPNNTDFCEIYLRTIKEQTPTHFDQETTDPPDDAFTMRVIAHESGHATGIPHYQYGGTGTRLTVMAYVPDAGWPADFWNNIPSNYDADDMAQFQLKPTPSACPHALDSFQHGIRWNRRHG